MHTGEVELTATTSAASPCTSPRACSPWPGTARSSCSRTVKDLVAGSGFRFTPRGSHRLKGVPDEWELFAAALTTG